MINAVSWCDEPVQKIKECINLRVYYNLITYVKRKEGGRMASRKIGISRQILGVLLVLLLGASFPVSWAKTVLITGSNQGIGYEFAKQYARKDWRVIATHRRESEPESLVALREKYPNIEIEKIDVTKQDTIDALVGKLKGQPIDVLINNAGWPGNFMGPPQQFGTLDFAELPAVMDSMTVGVMRVTQAFIEHVRASEGKTVTVITSETGMFSAVLEGHVPHNRAFWLGASKAAINYLFTKMAFEQKDSGVIYLMLDPGLVRDTNEEVRMRAEGKEAPQIQILPGMPERVNIDITVAGMIKVTDEATPADSGRIYKYDGKELEN